LTLRKASTFGGLKRSAADMLVLHRFRLVIFAVIWSAIGPSPLILDRVSTAALKGTADQMRFRRFDRRAEAAAVNGERVAAAAVIVLRLSVPPARPGNLHDARPVISIGKRQPLISA
jgi:hypothetical protein